MSNGAETAALATVQQLVASCADVLQLNLVSAILHGSLTQSDFRPGESDVDLLLVVERALTSEETSALLQVVEEADLGPAAGVDLLVVTRLAAATSEDDPDRELLVGRWPGSEEELEIEGPAPRVSDNWPEFSEARTNGRALVGLPPREVIGEVPPGRVRANSLGHLRRWLGLTDDEPNAAFMVITACRMWRFEMTGEHVSKSAAAHWALQQDPSLTAVESALSARTDSEPRTITPTQVETVLRRVFSDFGADAPA